MKKSSYGKRSWIKFEKGNLSGIQIYTTENFAKNYIDGNTDKEMMLSIASNAPKGKIIFDVGAFIGTSSLVFSKLVGPNGRVIAFEPNPYNMERFKINIKKNPKYGKNISVYSDALSDSCKSLNMVLSDNIDNGHSSTSRIEGSHSTIRDRNLPPGFMGVEVQTNTLDAFIKENKIIPDILKVDIEGAEYDFLLGSIETIKASHPSFYIELHSQYCATKCTELLVLEGYSINVLHEEEDNRIMVFAEYVNVAKGADVVRMKYENNSFDMLQNMSNTLAIMNTELSINVHQIMELKQVINQLKVENESLKNLIIVNENLLKKIKEIELSRSWKITQPLRSINRRLK